LGEDLEEYDRVLGLNFASKARIDAQFGAEECPSVPMELGSAGARRNDAGLDRCRRSAEITAEVM
jgi:hypothetical protein